MVSKKYLKRKRYPNIWIVYCIKNSKNNRIYIGVTSYYYARMSSHLNNLRQNIHSNIVLQLDYNIDGEHSFVFTPIELFTTERQGLDKEKQLIKEYNEQAYNNMLCKTLYDFKSLVSKYRPEYNIH